MAWSWCLLRRLGAHRVADLSLSCGGLPAFRDPDSVADTTDSKTRSILTRWLDPTRAFSNDARLSDGGWLPASYTPPRWRPLRVSRTSLWRRRSRAGWKPRRLSGRRSFARGLLAPSAIRQSRAYVLSVRGRASRRLIWCRRCSTPVRHRGRSALTGRTGRSRERLAPAPRSRDAPDGAGGEAVATHRPWARRPSA